MSVSPSQIIDLSDVIDVPPTRPVKVKRQSQVATIDDWLAPPSKKKTPSSRVLFDDDDDDWLMASFSPKPRPADIPLTKQQLEARIQQSEKYLQSVEKEMDLALAKSLALKTKILKFKADLVALK